MQKRKEKNDSKLYMFHTTQSIIKQKSQKVYDYWTVLIFQTRIQTMCNINKKKIFQYKLSNQNTR